LLLPLLEEVVLAEQMVVLQRVCHRAVTAAHTAAVVVVLAVFPHLTVEQEEPAVVAQFVLSGPAQLANFLQLA
jgi:hypothetical protein